jgi:chromosome segregation ATPase
MRQATQEELQLLVIKLNEENKKLKIDVRFATEKIEYWEDIATQQNTCIVSQANRYDLLLEENSELKSQNKPDNSVRITELEALLLAEKTRNKEIDKMLESYEDSFRSMSYKIKSLEKDIKDLTNAYTLQTKDLKIAQANESLFLRELTKYSQARKEFKEMARDYSRENRTCSPRPQKTKSLKDVKPNPRGICLDEMITKEQQDREIYQEEEGFRPIKSIKVTFDKIGNYMPGRG